MAGLKTSIKEFESWCLNPTRPDHINNFNVENMRQEYRRDPEPDSKTIEEIQNMGMSAQPVSLHLKKFGKIGSISLSFDHSPKTYKLSPDAFPNFWDFVVVGINPFKISGAIIRNLTLQSNNHETIIRDCYIDKLNVTHSPNNLVLIDCLIGTLTLGSGVLFDFTVTGGTIRSIVCPASDNDNPFTGSVTFMDVEWPTQRMKSKLFKGPQQYRNLRAHLRKLENVPEASRMRALELASERETDTGINKRVNWLYGAISDYGRSPARPFILAVILYLLTANLVFYFDASVLGMKNLEVYTGWRSALICNDQAAKWTQAYFLPLQSMINPGGIFGAKMLVVATSGWWQTATVIQGLICDLFLAMSVFAIRKRFKIQ